MIRAALFCWARARKPDFVIGGHYAPYLLRWFLIPRNPVFNVYVHHFLRSDDDRALHDHPWLANMSWLLEGSYREWTKKGAFDRSAGALKLRFWSAPHRIELTTGPCWTLFVTGPRVRSWGFHCPKGWVHWRDFTDSRDKGAVGKGCGE